ncbi:MAG TPA: threonine synthase [Candidatus Limnocylindrales bacterium]|nr:threonine synthase [Candidatus Limnocylindrales bacterium]
MAVVTELRCRACGQRVPAGPVYVCAACFGPLEVVYDGSAWAGLTRAAVEARPAGIWRYLEFLPVEAPPARSLPVGSTPLLAAGPLADEAGLDRLWLKDDTRNPTLSFKDRVVAVAAARAVAFGFDTLACASTGNLAGAVAAAAAAHGLRGVVFVPADIEPGKIRQALAFGATIVPVEGTYDEVNRLCVQVADEFGWAFANVTLRPWYAEGSKTLAFEVAEGLGWRLPDAVVVPVASGSLLTKVAAGFGELVRAGLVEERPVRLVGAQPAGCAPVAEAFRSGAERPTPVRRPQTLVRSLAIGDPADGGEAARLARETGGSIEAVPDDATVAAIARLATQEGILVEPAGGCTLAGALQARASGVIGPDDETVVLLTGNGIKTPEALAGVLPEGSFGADGIRPEARVRPSLAAFEAWLDQRAWPAGPVAAAAGE